MIDPVFNDLCIEKNGFVITQAPGRHTIPSMIQIGGEGSIRILLAVAGFFLLTKTNVSQADPPDL